ncbi:MAG TPA: hypothetical protein VKE91_01225 [Blastocatellia bacterium]|nr:hypothetical protein [Blastocatellia bacterium]
MSKTWAIVLSIIGGIFLLAIIAVGGAVYWFYQNKDRLIRAAENIGKEAKEFGANTNNEGCLKEALSRHKRDKSITGRISTSAFLTVCLQESAPSPGFCDGAPASGEIMKSANWRLKKCAEAGLQDDQGCQQIFSAVQSYCHRSKNTPEK